MGDTELVQGHLKVALDELLAAAVLVGGLDETIPDEALDALLATDPTIRNARAAVQDALQAVALAAVGRDAILTLEEATNAFVARAAEAGFKLGARVGRGSR